MAARDESEHSMSGPALALRRYRKTASLAASSAIGESRLFLLDYLLRLLRVLVLLAIWRTVLPAHGTTSGMTLAAVLTYTVISEAFAEQMAARTNISDELWVGSIATRMLQPMTMVEHYAADMVGRWLLGLALFSLPLLLCAPLLGVSPLPASPLAAVLFVLSLALAVTIGLAVDFFFLGLTFALGQAVWVISRMRMAVTMVLSGALLPLALLPWGLGNLFTWLPFASMASAPLQIYTGTGNVALLLLAQSGWAIALWPLTLWLWRANREKLVGYGG
jgi:viologen exporter family transport system permease protein